MMKNEATLDWHLIDTRIVSSNFFSEYHCVVRRRKTQHQQQETVQLYQI